MHDPLTILLGLLNLVGAPVAAAIIGAFVFWLVRPRISVRIASTQPVTIAADKPANVTVHIDRWRYSGELTIHIDNLPDGLCAEPVEIPCGGQQGQIALVAKGRTFAEPLTVVRVVAGAETAHAIARLHLRFEEPQPPDNGKADPSPTGKRVSGPTPPPVQPSTPPPPPPPNRIKVAFDEFRANRVQYATVLLRRVRVGQLLKVFAAAETITVEEFDREVWRVCSSMSLDGQSVTPWPKASPDRLVEDSRLSAFERAVQAGTVTFHGNAL